MPYNNHYQSKQTSQKVVVQEINGQSRGEISSKRITPERQDYSTRELSEQELAGRQALPNQPNPPNVARRLNSYSSNKISKEGPSDFIRQIESKFNNYHRRFS